MHQQNKIKISKITNFRCPTPNCSHLFTFPESPETRKCQKCDKNISLKDPVENLALCEKQYKTGLEFLETGEREKAISVLREALDTFHRCVIYFCQVGNNCGL